MDQQAADASARLFDLLTLAGTLLLWLGFLLLGVIARRYEIVFKKWTGWKALMLAPSGILIYVAFIVLKILPWQMGEATQRTLEIIAYACLLLSSAACLVLTDRFYRFIRNILSPAGPKGS